MSRLLFVRTIPMPSRKNIVELYQQGVCTAEISKGCGTSTAKCSADLDPVSSSTKSSTAAVATVKWNLR
uniref:Uncharacterized protein n=1 Tax=Rubinisphaera brasiliensis (strain ATCC 49424 / DSM 5305 / JCM 21570 / IAM 15109 / NBRC 103401 / IFAM 1448) TaxID=756272 RepID=F0SR40_RUBBR|nr:hypothetical protein Plabr_3692 [Rubinisphaera brasiliensis DSM 5305]